MCNLILYCAEGKQIQSILRKSPFSRQPFTENLFGAVSCFGQVLRDPVTNQPAVFFVFEDVDVKAVGHYTLQCQIVDLERYPQLIVKIVFQDPKSIQEIRSCQFLCILSLYCENGVDNLTILKKSPFSKHPYTDNLYGETHKLGEVHLDPKSLQASIYFVFEDINIKAVGEYTLLCQVVDLNRYAVILIIDLQYSQCSPARLRS
ncbi:hypothetical protein HDV06_004167 [Boothiomyces sp. JEL0866]|nr:hypothetical protein HDV06_004167 [Boothiomyces sp. JEL0866]